MTKIQVFAILALGGLAALVASGQTGQAGDTSSYAPAGAGQYASPAADEGISVNGDEIPDPLADAAPGSGDAPTSAEMIDNGAVTLVEPYDGYGELSLDELSAALSMPAGPQPWDLGEFARWQEPPAQDAYGEPVTIIDEGQAIIGLIEPPVEGEGELAAAQPQALPTEPATPPAGPKPVVPNAPLMANALTSAYGAAGTVYATTADYSCEPPMYAPTYYSYYYAYPYACAPIVLPPWSNPHWPLTPYYCIYPQWTNYYGTYIGYPYVGYYGTYASYSYGGYFGTYAGYPYTGYFGTYIGYPYASYYGGYPHQRHLGSGAFLGFSFGGSSWSIYGQLGLPAYQHGYFRGDHDRDFPRHSDSRFLAHGGSPSARSFASGVPVRPWRPSVSHQIAAARNGRSFDLSTDRSQLGLRGPVDLNRRALTTAAGAGATRATALQRPGRTLTTGGMSAQAAPAVGRAGRTLSTSPRGMTGATAQDQLQQRRDAYMDVLRGRNVGPGGTAESPPAGVVRPAFGATSPAGTASAGPRTDHGFGAGDVSRRSSAPDINAAVTARQQEMRNDLLRRLNATPAASGSVPAPAGPTRPHSTFQPQVAPRQQPVSPGGSATVGPRSLAPRSLTPNSLTPRTVTTPTVSETPSVTLTPTSRITSTAQPRGMRFSSSTWPHDSTAAPSATTPPSYTPRTFTPRTAAPSAPAPSASEPRSYYTPRTFTPRTVVPSEAAPSATPSRSYTQRTFTPRTFAPSEAAPSATPPPSYTPRTFTPRTVAPNEPAPSATPSRSYTPRTFTPRTAAPSAPAPSASEPRSYTPRTFTPRTAAPSSAEPSFSRSAPSFSRFSPAPPAPSGPTMSTPPARTFSPAPSQAPTMSRSAEYSSPRSRRAATAEETAPPSRRR